VRGYYFITDNAMSRKGNLSDVRSALRAGVKIIQYRDKSATTSELFREAKSLKDLCKKKSARFIVNDRLDIALAVDADGLHIGQDDLPYSVARKLLGRNKLIGVTVHSLFEAKDAQCQGADYLGVAPVFASTTKIDAGRVCGVDLIRKIKSKVKIPVIAIGGINLSNAKEVVSAGADGLCAISAVITKRNVNQEIKKFQALFKSSRKGV